MEVPDCSEENRRRKKDVELITRAKTSTKTWWLTSKSPRSMVTKSRTLSPLRQVPRRDRTLDPMRGLTNLRVGEIKRNDLTRVRLLPKSQFRKLKNARQAKWAFWRDLTWALIQRLKNQLCLKTARAFEINDSKFKNQLYKKVWKKKVPALRSVANQNQDSNLPVSCSVPIRRSSRWRGLAVSKTSGILTILSSAKLKWISLFKIS